MMNQEQLARYQQEFAKIGEAHNQCAGCGVYRLDGLPPILHREDCPDRADPWEMIIFNAEAEQKKIRKLYGLDLS